MKARALTSLVLAILLAVSGTRAFAADLSVDRLELLTHGSIDGSGLFTVNSRLFFDLSIEGGDKFAGLLRMDFLSSNIETALSLAGGQAVDLPTALAKLNNLTSMGFRTAAVTAKRLFGANLDATYFVGYLESFGSGSDFMTLFGIEPFGTALSGPMAFPDGIGGNPNLYYDGLDAVYGTGFRLSLYGKDSLLSLYTYQDADIGAGAWTANIRGLLAKGPLRAEAYLGASSSSLTTYGLYRGGLLFDVAPGKVGEFFAQVGLTRWDPAAGLDINNFYFLFEPRVVFYPGSLAITVFYHPGWYRETATAEQNALDLAVNLKFGNISKSGSQGGLSSLLSFRPLEATPLTVDLSPYYSAIASGMEWSFKVDVRVFPIPAVWYGMFRPYIGVTTSF
jgi:hypothetical protein